MARRTALAVLAVAVVVAGACGDETSTGVSSTMSTLPTPRFTPAQLSDGLLTAADLGAGWMETQRDVFTMREPENPSIDPSLWCPGGQGESLVVLAGHEGADVELAVSSTPYMVRSQAWSNAAVVEYFTTLVGAIAACAGVTWEDEEGNSHTLTPAASPAIGDEAVRWSITIDLVEPEVSYRAEQMAARFGEVVLVVQGGERPDTGPAAAVAAFDTIVELAGAEMAALVAG
jgi:hypothetical protein